MPSFLKKYQKYPLLKHAFVLAKLNKSPYGVLHHMTPHDNYSITIHVRTMTIWDISHEKMSKILLSK